MPVTTKTGIMESSSPAAYFANDPYTGNLIMTVPNSNLPRMAMKDVDAASQKLRVESMFARKHPLTPTERLA
jgi:hypothetical protein